MSLLPAQSGCVDNQSLTSPKPSIDLSNRPFDLLLRTSPPLPPPTPISRYVSQTTPTEVKYSDFFAPPTKPPSGAARRAHSKALKSQPKKGKKGGRSAEGDEMEMDLDEDEMMEDDDEDEEDDDEEEDEEELEEDDEEEEYDEDEAGEDDLADVPSGGKKGLFDSDDEEKETDAGEFIILFRLWCLFHSRRRPSVQATLLLTLIDQPVLPFTAPLSTHAKRLAALSAQIAAFEQENAGPKDWAMAGEASSRARPLNAILEQDLEYDTVGKQVPLVTEEKVKNLEDKIKQRILEVRPFPPHPAHLSCLAILPCR